MTYKDLEEYLNNKGISKMNFCRETGISPQILTNAKNRGGHFSASTMQKMENFFNRDKIENNDLSSIESELISTFRTATDEEKRMIVEMLAFFKSKKQGN